MTGSDDNRSGRPLVTAVVPVFNGERYVAEAIASVLAQTYEPIECLVVDVGSTDATPDVLRRFGAAVRVVRSTNRGVASARNLGVTCAAGEFVAFLDADDTWRPDKIEKQMDVVRLCPGVGLVYSGLAVVDEALTPIGSVDPAPPELALRNTLLLEQPFATGVGSTGLLPREVVVEVGGFDERLSTSADCDLTCRVGSSYPLACVSEPLAQYRSHGEQMSGSLDRFEHDMTIIVDKLFGGGRLPRDVASLEHRARANLHFALAVASARLRDPGRAARNLVRAFREDPRRAAALVRNEGVTRYGRRRTPAGAPG